MKQFKPVIITAVICAIFVGLFFLITNLPTQQGKDPNEQTDDFSQSPTNQIIDKNPNSVKEVRIQTDFGEKFTVEYTLDENGEQTGTIKDGGSNFAYNASDLYTLAGYVSNITGMEEIPDAKGRDAEFGFKKPVRKIDISYVNGDKIQLLIGSDTPLGEGKYLKRVDTGRVYIIGGSTAEILMMTTKDYRSTELFSPLADISRIKYISVTLPGEKTYTVTAKETEEGESTNSQYTSKYEITEPVVAQANDTPVEERLLQPLVDMKIKDLVEDNPKDLKKYGLDKPIKIKFENKAMQVIEFLVGGKSENGGRYVMRTDIPSVLETEEQLPWDNLKYTELMMQLIWLHNMKDVDSVEYRLPDGTQHMLQVNVQGQNINAKLDGVAMDESNANNLFLLTVRFTLQGEVDPSQRYGDPEIKMTMKLKNGKTTTLALSKLNQRQYAAEIDGQPARYYVNVVEVNELVEAFNALKNGGKIPDMF